MQDDVVQEGPTKQTQLIHSQGGTQLQTMYGCLTKNIHRMQAMLIQKDNSLMNQKTPELLKSCFLL